MTTEPPKGEGTKRGKNTATTKGVNQTVTRVFFQLHTPVVGSTPTHATTPPYGAQKENRPSGNKAPGRSVKRKNTMTTPALTAEIFHSPQFGGLRTIEDNGRIYFYGRDAATALGYQNPNDALTKHCKGVAIRYPLQTPGGTQQARFITEGDLYRLIASSRLPAAQQFEAWIFDEVLPSIRQRGGYLTPEATEKALTDPDFIIQLATSLKQERAKRAELEAQAALDKPKVLFADAVSVSTSSILVGDLAKILKGNGINIGATRLFSWMRDHGYLISRRGSDWNIPTQKSMDLGLFKIKETVVTHSDGHTTINKTPKVTGKGQQYFIDRFLSGTFTP